MNVLDQNNETIQSAFETIDIISQMLDELFNDYTPILNGERYITDNQLQNKLHVCDRTLQDYRFSGMLSYYQFKKKILYLESDVEIMLNERYVKAWNV